MSTVPTALSDSACDLVYEDVKFGIVRRVRWVATIGATGACTLVAARSSVNTTISRTSTGLYAVTFGGAGAKNIIGMGGNIENDDTSPTAADARIVTGAAFNLGAGTGNILTTAGDDGDVADPTSGTTLYFWLDIACGT